MIETNAWVCMCEGGLVNMGVMNSHEYACLEARGYFPGDV